MCLCAITRARALNRRLNNVECFEYEMTAKIFITLVTRPPVIHTLSVRDYNSWPSGGVTRRPLTSLHIFRSSKPKRFTHLQSSESYVTFHCRSLVVTKAKWLACTYLQGQRCMAGESSECEFTRSEAASLPLQP